MSNRMEQWSVRALGGGALVALFAGACVPSTEVVGSMDAGGASGADDGNLAGKSGSEPGSGGTGGGALAGAGGSGALAGSGNALAGSGGSGAPVAGTGGSGAPVAGSGSGEPVAGSGSGGSVAGSGGTVDGTGRPPGSPCTQGEVWQDDCNQCWCLDGTVVCTLVQCQRCEIGFNDCDGLAETGTRGCETDLYSSSTNCGDCGHVCPSGSACIYGECSDELVCAPETADCDADSANGCETDIMTSPANCGSCGFTCAGTESECVGAECVAPCPEPAPQGGCFGGLGFAKNPELGAQCCEYAFGPCSAPPDWTVYPTREECLAGEE